ncbi:transposable element Tcb2 transposase [Trichonephila clavipes]|nr:transposable element Tcb2 transposase [Trichonephila clavipes]
MSMMSQRSHLTDSEAWTVVGSGTVFLETGSAGRRPGHGRRWETTPIEDRYLVLTARRHRNMNSSPTTPSLSYCHHGFNSDCPKPAPWCRSVCSPTDVLVYGGISIDGRTDLYIIRDGPLTAHRYRDEILRPIVVPYAAEIGDDFILMDDNCRSHRANLMEDFLFEEGIV